MSKAVFGVRISYVDTYQASPLDKSHGLQFSKERYIQHPVIRIFGATPAGQRCCVHIHGAFPYLYVHIEDARALLANPSGYAKALETNLERELKPEYSTAASGHDASASGGVSMAGGSATVPPPSAAPGSDSNPRPRGAKAVRSVQIVRAVPFYGFHFAGPLADASISAGSNDSRFPEHSPGHLFARIVLYSPSMVRRATEVLQAGTVSGFPPFQPYEAHVPFLLQAFIDYNLAGMALLAVKDVRFRAPLPAHPPRKPLKPSTLLHRVGLSRGAVPLAYDDDAADDGDGVEGFGRQADVEDSRRSVMTRVWLASNTPAELVHGAAPLIDHAEHVQIIANSTREREILGPAGEVAGTGGVQASGWTYKSTSNAELFPAPVAPPASSVAYSRNRAQAHPHAPQAHVAGAGQASGSGPAVPLPVEPPWLSLRWHGVYHPGEPHGCARDGTLSRESSVQLEADVWVEDILNPLDRERLRERSRARAGNRYEVLANTGAGEDDDLPFGSVFSLATLWEEEKLRCAAAGASGPKTSMTGLAFTQGIGASQQAPVGASVAIPALTPATLLSARQAAAGSIPDADLLMESTLTALAAADARKVRESETLAVLEERTKLSAAISNFPPAHVVSYGQDTVLLQSARPRGMRIAHVGSRNPETFQLAAQSNAPLATSGTQELLRTPAPSSSGGNSGASALDWLAAQGPCSAPAHEAGAGAVAQDAEGTSLSQGGESALDWLAAQSGQMVSISQVDDEERAPVHRPLNVSGVDDVLTQPLAGAGRMQVDYECHDSRPPTPDGNGSVHSERAAFIDDEERTDDDGNEDEDESDDDIGARLTRPRQLKPHRVSFGPDMTPTRSAPRQQPPMLPSPFSIMKLARQNGVRVSDGARAPSGQPSPISRLHNQDTPLAQNRNGRRRSGISSSRRSALEWQDIVSSQADARALDINNESEGERGHDGEHQVSKHARLSGASAIKVHSSTEHVQGEALGFDEVEEFVRLTQASQGEDTNVVTVGRLQFNTVASMLPSFPSDREDHTANAEYDGNIGGVVSCRRAVAWDALQLSLAGGVDSDQPRLVALAAEAAGIRCHTPPPTQEVTNALNVSTLDELRESSRDADADAGCLCLGTLGRDRINITDGMQMAVTQPFGGESGCNTAVDVERIITAADRGKGEPAWFRWNWTPPTATAVHSTFQVYGLPEAVDPVPHYGINEDVPDRPRVMAGMVFRIPGAGVAYTPPFDSWRACSLMYRRHALEKALRLARRQANRSKAQREAHSTPDVLDASAMSAAADALMLDICSQEGSEPGLAPTSFSITRAGTMAGAGGSNRRDGQQASSHHDGVGDDGHVDFIDLDDSGGQGDLQGVNEDTEDQAEGNHRGRVGEQQHISSTADFIPRQRMDVLQATGICASISADQLLEQALAVAPPYPRRRTMEAYAAAAREGVGVGLTSPDIAAPTGTVKVPVMHVHAFLPEVLPSLAGMWGTAGASISASSTANGGAGNHAPVLLRRFVAGQPEFSALPSFSRSACMRTGHTMSVNGAHATATRTVCTRMWVEWSSPFPSRRTVAKWALRHPSVVQQDARQDVLMGKADMKGKGTCTVAGNSLINAAISRHEPPAQRFDANTGRLLPTVDPGKETVQLLDAMSGVHGTTGAEFGYTPQENVVDVSALSAGSGGGASTRMNATGGSNTTPGTITPSTIRAMKRAALSRGLSSQISPAAGRASRASVGQAVGFKRQPAATGAAKKLEPPGTPAESQSHSFASKGSSASTAPGDVNQHLTVLSLEVVTRTRGSLLPDPRHDPILALTYSVMDDDLVECGRAEAAREGREARLHDALVVGVIVVDPASQPIPMTSDGFGPSLLHWFDEGGIGRLSSGLGLGSRVLTLTVPDEVSAMWAFVALVRAWDPDILTGWEVQQASWGYLFDRAERVGVHLAALLSRTPGAGVDRRHGEDEWGDSHGSGLWITGRTVLNGWRILKGELKLGIYTLESVAWAVLRQRVPHFTHATLTQWWNGGGVTAVGTGAGASLTRWRVLEYSTSRAAIVLAMLDHLDIVGRTSETARLFGIDFYSVLSRGSQYRVEAVMVRVSKPLGFLAPSASRRQVTRQAAMEVQPLILEPQSRLYTGPVIVLDFQSLYPSIVIAYNMCYSTCLGRLARRGAGVDAGASTEAGTFSAPSPLVYPKLGFMDFEPPSGAVQDMWEGPGHATAIRSADKFAGPPQASFSTSSSFSAAAGVDSTRPHRPDSLFVSPNGAIFAPWRARQGILPRMLNEILDTRVMVKDAAKKSWAKGDAVLQRVLHARQFALKMIANVTYGYTAAGFSGRMPCAEIADAIVSTGRDTLDRAIRLVEGHPTWRARVVYGDTDSMFVHVPGRNWREAWAIGEQIAAEVTARNPRPVQLKLDKVYSRSVLVTKKRYAGWMYERGDARDEDGVLDVKGLEMQRRDSCSVVQSTMEAVLRQLFTAPAVDLSGVKGYLTRQWRRMHEGRLPLSDFTFAKEVYIGKYSTRGPPPPHAIVASKAMMADSRAEPRQGERVRYVVAYGPRGVPLVDLVLAPQDMLFNPGTYRLHVGYYIDKHVIPSLTRITSLFGVDLREWYADMRRPAPRRYRLPGGVVQGHGQGHGYGGPDKYSLHTDKLRQAFAGPESRAVAALETDMIVNNDAIDLTVPTQLPGARPVMGAAGGPPYGMGGIKRRRGAVGPGTGTRTLDAFYAQADCELCGVHTQALICDGCAADAQKSAYILHQRRRGVEEGTEHLLAVCASCAGIADVSESGAAACVSLDCPVLFQRLKLRDELVHYNVVLRELGLLQ